MSVIERQQFIMGPEVPALEADIARFCHTKHAIGCASGTDALLLPLMALDLKPGDEVICPAFTFFATAGTVHNAGGTPVFVDIDPATFNVTAATIEPAITKRTRAIIVVHLFGQMVEMERILALAAKHNLPVIANSIARIECTIHSVTEAGDHWFVLGNVLHMEATRDEDPMLFHRGRYGGFAELG